MHEMVVIVMQANSACFLPSFCWNENKIVENLVFILPILGLPTSDHLFDEIPVSYK